MRKLVTIRTVDNIVPIKNADFIELVIIGGWQCIVKKGEFSIGDKGLFFEIDSWIPATDERFNFLGSTKDYLGNQGWRIKTIKLRKTLSQGLLLPLSTFPELDLSLEDHAETLGVIKWDDSYLKKSSGNSMLSGSKAGKFPSFIAKTDQERLQNLSHYFELHKDTYFEETLKLDGCFLNRTLIETWDGEKINIGDIVNKGLRPSLIGINKYGKLVPCEIVKTFRNGVKTKWLDISYIPFSKSKIPGKSGKVRTTPNHIFFTNNMEEVIADNLKIGNKLLMQYTTYDASGLHFIKSGLLGDGSILGNGHYSYNESHITKHDEYNKYIKNIFPSNKSSTRIQTSGYGSEIRSTNIFTTHDLKLLREEWYPKGIKKIPKDLSWIDDFTIAKWYMDDGSLSHSKKQNDRANFSTHAFTKKDVNRLADKLIEMYNISVTIYYSKGWTLRVNYTKGSINNLWKAIAPHVIGCMRYKLPEQYRNMKFIHYPKTLNIKTTIAVEITNKQKVPFTKKNFPSGSIGFDLETTTNNYFCNGLLVHNSSITAFRVHIDLPWYKKLINHIKPNTFALSRFGVCSRNIELKSSDNYSKTFTNNGKSSEYKQSDFWATALKYNLDTLVPEGYAIQAELIGPKIQSNHEKVNDLELHIYDIYDIKNQCYLDPDEREYMMSGQLQSVPHVTIINKSVQIFNICKDFDSFQERVTGESFNPGTISEGRVYKSIDGLITFKLISNKFLLNEN